MQNSAFRVIANRVLSIGLISVLLMCTVACTVDEVLSDTDLLLQTAAVVCTALGPISPSDSAACSVVANVATVGLGEIQTLYDAWKASGAATDLQKLQAAITALKTNLPQELSAAHITDPRTVATVAAWVKLVTSTLTAILNLLPQLSTAANSRQRDMALMTSLPKPESLKGRWQTEVCLGNVDCGRMVKVHHIHSR